MIVVAYEVYNLRSHLKNPAMNGVDKELMIEKEPSALDLFCYMTCFAGLFTGNSAKVDHQPPLLSDRNGVVINRKSTKWRDITVWLFVAEYSTNQHDGLNIERVWMFFFLTQS